MTAYRRLYMPGGTYFFTLCLEDGNNTALVTHIDALRAAYAATLRDRPFRTDAIVILPDHLHAIWTLPPGDSDFSTRWRLIKTRFSKATGLRGPQTASRRAKGERGLWQRRFWEHHIRDDADLAWHLRYCWQDPVRHGLVERARDWTYASLHRDIRLGRTDAEGHTVTA